MVKRRENQQQIMDAVRQAVKDQCWTQTDLADAAGLRSQGRASKILSGKVDVRVSTLQRLCDVLGLAIVERE